MTKDKPKPPPRRRGRYPKAPNEALATLVAPTPHAANHQTIPARVRELATKVDHTDRRARIRFMKTLGPDYERGRTSEYLASLWGFSVKTMNADMSIAWAETLEEADPTIDKAIWWHEMYALQEQAKEDGATLRAAIERLRIADELGGAMDAKMLSEAYAKSTDALARIQELMARANGFGGSEPQVVIHLGGDKVSMTVQEGRQAVERAMQFFEERHPELLEEYLEYTGALPQAGQR